MLQQRPANALCLLRGQVAGLAPGYVRIAAAMSIGVKLCARLHLAASHAALVSRGAWRTVLDRVFAKGQHFEITQVVVGLVTVLVMHRFPSGQSATKMLLHDVAVFQHFAPADTKLSVSVASNESVGEAVVVASAVGFAVATTRTVLAPQLQLAGEGTERLPAHNAISSHGFILPRRNAGGGVP